MFNAASRVVIYALMLLLASSTFAQAQSPAATTETTSQQTVTDAFDNPISIVNQATQMLSGRNNSDPISQAGLEEDTGLSSTLSIIFLLTVLSIAPSILILCTSFVRIVVVLALLRQAIGTQALPPSQVIVGLAVFMSFLIMAPTFDRVNQEALVPLQANEITERQAWELAKRPVRDFMIAQIDYAGNWQDVYMVLNYRNRGAVENPSELKIEDIDMLTLIPAFILSELKIAFLMGFRLYLPFLVIDMVVSSVLISMGMMMLPPVFISLPFKLLLFVLVDGWMLVAGQLLNSFAVPGIAEITPLLSG